MALLSSIPFWIFIVAGILIAIVVLIRFSNNINVLSFIKENFFYFFVLLFLAILVISVINIHTSYDIDYSTLDGWKELFGIYTNWLSTLIKNIASITGYAVNQEWIAKPVNETAK